MACRRPGDKPLSDPMTESADTIDENDKNPNFLYFFFTIAFSREKDNASEIHWKVADNVIRPKDPNAKPFMFGEFSY